MKITTQPMEPDLWRPPLVALVGFGMSRTDMTGLAEQWVATAEVLAGGKRALDAFPEHRGERIVIRAPVDDALTRVREASINRRVAVLASGDPFFFGVGRRLVGLLGVANLTVFPNVTSVQTLCARLGISWERMSILSVHGRAESNWFYDLRTRGQVILFTDNRRTPAWIGSKLTGLGLPDCRLVVAENLGMAEEKIHDLTADEAGAMEFCPLNLVAVFMPAGKGDGGGFESPLPALGLPDRAFQHQKGLITKQEIRAVVLAQLQLRAGQFMWDIGAGSGSVSVEAARMVRLRGIAAIEKNSDRYNEMLTNIRRYLCGEITPIHDGALQAIEELPAPDRVFIGGSGGELAPLINKIANRLAADGRVVQTAVTLDTLEQARSQWRRHGFHVDVSLVQVGRSVPIGNSSRIEALNPVFVISSSGEPGYRGAPKP